MREVFEYTQFWAVGHRDASSRWARCTRCTRGCETAEAVARAGIEAGALFDKNSALPMTLYTVKAK